MVSTHPVSDMIRRYALLIFLVLTFGISWLGFFMGVEILMWMALSRQRIWSS